MGLKTRQTNQHLGDWELENLAPGTLVKLAFKHVFYQFLIEVSIFLSVCGRFVLEPKHF